MDVDSVKRFLEAMGASPDSFIVDEDRRWVRCSCIFAPWTHKSGKDSHPSFGMTIRDDVNEGESIANCRTCGSYSTNKEYWHVEELLHRMWLVSGEYPKAAAYEYIHNRQSEDYSALSIKIREQKEVTPVYPLPERLLNKYPLIKGQQGIEAADVREYLYFHRGIPFEVQDLFEVRYNADKHSMLFALTGMDGEVYTFRERLCDVRQKNIWTLNQKTSGMTDIVFSRTTASGAMFGMKQFDKRKRIVALCEGEIDAMKLYTFGVTNPLASATNQITMAQCKAIHPYVDKIIHFPDADKAGAISVKKLLAYFATTDVTVQVADCGNVLVQEDFSTKKRPAKDPGDLTSKEQIGFLMDTLVSPSEFLDKYK